MEKKKLEKEISSKAVKKLDMTKFNNVMKECASAIKEAKDFIKGYKNAR